jgi:hypothetical protein
MAVEELSDRFDGTFHRKTYSISRGIFDENSRIGLSERKNAPFGPQCGIFLFQIFAEFALI